MSGIGRAVGIDRTNKVLRGYVVAQAGLFKSNGRGLFDSESLSRIVFLGNLARLGLPCRFGHSSIFDSALGKHLGRAKSFFMSHAKNEAGQTVECVRADLYFDRTATQTPPNGGGKPLATYVMDLAESDPAALSSSLVLDSRKDYSVDARGHRQTDASGNPLPPRWIPTKLISSDIVDTGDAVDGLLSPLPSIDLHPARQFRDMDDDMAIEFRRRRSRANERSLICC